MDRTCLVALALCAAGLACAWWDAPRQPRPAETGAGAPVLATWAPDAERPGPLSGTGPSR